MKSDDRSAARLRLLPCTTVLALALAAAPLGALERNLSRTGPDNTWCPFSVTGDSNDPNFPDSEPDELNSGGLEVSFFAPPSGIVEVTLSLTRTPGVDPAFIDNLIVVPRSLLFDDAASLFDDVICYQLSDAAFPQARAPIFNPPALETFAFFEDFPDLPADWSYVNAGWRDLSATAQVDPSDPFTISGSCDIGPCPTGTLELGVVEGVPSEARFTVTGLSGGVAYTLVGFWDIEPGEQLTIDVEPIGGVVIPTLAPAGALALALLLAAAAAWTLRCRRTAASGRS